MDDDNGLVCCECNELVKALRELRNAEWMMTHDWGGDRQAILDHVDILLSRYPETEEAIHD